MSNSLARTPAWNDAVGAFSAGVRPFIDQMWYNGGFLPSDVVGNILTTSDAEIGTLMMQLLPVAQQYAVVPVSNFRVGAVSAGMPMPGTGWCSLYLGANFEFTGTALSFSVHAEQSAVTNAWLHGEPGINALAISAAPCGYCRQFLYELATAQKLPILLPDNPKDPTAYSSTQLPTLLPLAFGPSDLGITGGLMDPKQCTHSLALVNGRSTDPVVLAALAAASGSYAPYGTATDYEYAGVAVQLPDNSIYAGRHAENAAYNPSMSPLESALTFMNMNRPLGSVRDVVRCVLVEIPTLASQLSATRAVLAAYAPQVTLEYYQAKTAT
jgi:cytidine deaminase